MAKRPPLSVQVQVTLYVCIPLKKLPDCWSQVVIRLTSACSVSVQVGSLHTAKLPILLSRDVTVTVSGQII
ncbi:hypothetical protein HOLleu_21210 [Holothuria leucospilota]|uniref:Uncharacterized protein n=1 Tax=Holothuria leucospilota TaxID=206669 RepID=A0A9Q1H6B7_HOLLE|nr:hypothetical protein HOLleu_21210 [Holothuria leucospilota]